MTRQFSFQTLPCFSPVLPAASWSCSILGPSSLGGPGGPGKTGVLLCASWHSQAQLQRWTRAMKPRGQKERSHKETLTSDHPLLHSGPAGATH